MKARHLLPLKHWHIIHLLLSFFIFFCVYSAVSFVAHGLLIFWVLSFTSTSGLFFLNAWDDVVDSEKHGGRLDCGLVGLNLYGNWVPNISNLHIFNLASVAINTPHHSWSVRWGVLGAQFSSHTDSIITTILRQGCWNDFKCTRKSLVWLLHGTFNWGGLSSRRHASYISGSPSLKVN